MVMYTFCRSKMVEIVEKFKNERRVLGESFWKEFCFVYWFGRKGRKGGEK